MKKLMLKFAVLLPITINLMACGQLRDSEKKPLPAGTYTNNSSSFSLLSSTDFQSRCTQNSGVITNSSCIYVSNYKSYAAGQSVSIAEYSIATIPNGAAIQAQLGSSAANVELYLANTLISPPSSARTTNGGELKWRISPGTYPTLIVTVYECRDQSWQVVRCPYAAL